MWDRFETDDGVVETWGGLGYGVSAAAAAVGPGWRVLPIAHVGRDLVARARRYLAAIPGVDTSALVTVAEPNNRVSLRYRDDAERVERLSGGVPGWGGQALAARAGACDALLVNFISGHEAELSACAALRTAFDGPIHADLHSLFLDIEADGTRVPRPLVDFERWVACFDSVQLNEVEATLAGARSGEPEPFARRVVELGPEVCVVTRGAAGVSWWRRGPGEGAADGARIDTGMVTIRSPRKGDPTGCGDVWGAAFFARTLAGDPVPEAAELATRLAVRNVEQRGAEGLYHVLAREVAL